MTNYRYKNLLDNQITELYLVQKLSMSNIAKKLNCNRKTIKSKLDKLKIPIRTGTAKYLLNDNYFDEINDEKAWLIGLIASDGCVMNNRLSIGQSGIEGLKLLEYIKNILNFDGPIRKKKTKSQIAYEMEICSPRIVSKLKEYNIVPRKSLIYEFPEKIIPWLYPFLRGYIDGDGTVGNYGYKLHYLRIQVSGTKNFINRCNEIITIKGYKDQHKDCRNLWRLSWTCKTAVSLSHLLYDNDKLYNYRKRQKYLDFLERK